MLGANHSTLKPLWETRDASMLKNLAEPWPVLGGIAFVVTASALMLWFAGPTWTDNLRVRRAIAIVSSVGATVILFTADMKAEDNLRSDLAADLAQRYDAKFKLPDSDESLEKPVDWRIGDLWVRCYLSEGKMPLGDQNLMCQNEKAQEFKAMPAAK